MRRSRVSGVLRRSVASLLVVALATAAFPRAAQATDNTQAKWIDLPANGYQHWVVWKFDSGFPTDASMRGYIQYGGIEWNLVNRELQFKKNQSSSEWRVILRYNDLWWPISDKLAVAQVGWCGDRICAGEITFNKNPNGWKHYWGQAPLVCPYVDIWSTSAHEFGHLVQMGHSSPPEDTMYADIPCGGTAKRSLTPHDKAGIQEMYAGH